VALRAGAARGTAVALPSDEIDSLSVDRYLSQMQSA
jgi:hypothetical protein